MLRTRKLNFNANFFFCISIWMQIFYRLTLRWSVKKPLYRFKKIRLPGIILANKYIKITAIEISVLDGTKIFYRNP